MRLFRHQSSKTDRRDHEDDGAPGSGASEQVSRGAGSERGLRALAAEGPGKVSALALLEQDDGNHEETNEYVDNDQEINHAVAFLAGS